MTCTRCSRCRASQVCRCHRVAAQHRVPDRGQLVQQLLEPQLVGLMHDDEQQLVVRRRADLGHLLGQQLRHPEVAAVGQQAAFLAEACARCLRVMPSPSVRSNFSTSGLASASGSAASATGVPSRIFLTGTSSFLPGQRARDPGHLVDLVGNVARGQLGAQQRSDLGGQRVVDGLALGRHDIEDQPPVLAELAGVDHQAVGDLRQPLDHPVELAGAHPDAAAVQGRVGPAVNDAAAVGHDHDPVAVPPDARIVGEIASPVPLAAGVIPESDRHRRHRLGQHELADLADDGPAGRRRRTRPWRPGTARR